MNALCRFAIVFVLSLVIVLPFLVAPTHALTDAPVTKITEWEMMWEADPERTIEDISADAESNKWKLYSEGDGLPPKPAQVDYAWLRFQLPELDLARPAILISKLIGKEVVIYIDNRVVYESNRIYPYYKNEILLQLDADEANKTVYILLFSDVKLAGLEEGIQVGESQTLSKQFLSLEMFDVILGAALIFVAFAMLFSIIFLNKSFLASWASLSVVIFSIGVMIITYSSFFHTVYSEFGFIAYHSFDFATILLMPAIFFFFESIFGRGPYGLITLFRKIQMGLASFNAFILVIGIYSNSTAIYFQIASIITFGFSVIIGNLLLFIFLIRYCLQKNKEAIILTTGFGLFALVGVSEMIWYFIRGMNYELFLWKWGILSFIASLIIILARRILQNYEQVVEYSKQLEVINNELQRSEKMEIISQLAASIAHEVRNPLQVTRGFLQLLRTKATSVKDESFMMLAIDELDRASEIITDFLTFAKPQLEQTTLLNIAEELQQIVGILHPLATMQGGVIEVDIAGNLYVHGNSTKFKQALINIIKNSIEALEQDGVISIRAYRDNDSNQVFICIKDNGEGMSEADLQRLGEPYYSKKSKGTGLGLMVTFRIIEVMEGEIEFFSHKGVGTEAIIQFPSAK
ncbi:ATP-binding protein [Paenibacillus sp. sgz302251]|uniref:ATP-binding protein n=1 Tax=Paenibacillus sp. sgz302251 TaxID=3414493 RepID=UPI003C79AA31